MTDARVKPQAGRRQCSHPKPQSQTPSGFSALYTAKGTKQFHSVTVVIDRTVLDDQLQETIYQFEYTDGVGGAGGRHHHG